MDKSLVQSTDAVFKYSVQVQCTSTLYKYSVQVQCTSTLYKYTVQVQWTSTVYKYGVKRQPTNTVVYKYIFKVQCVQYVTNFWAEFEIGLSSCKG